ncbi:MAG: branched-chain amino acid ABC transporter permease [Sneathiellaceae bacterium]
MLSTIVIGLSVAMLLFLLASGLTLIFGMLGVINFAHGALYMVGAFASWQVVAWTGSFWLALAAAPLLVAVIGLAMELLLKPLYARDHVFQLLLTFGGILVLEEAVRLVWGLDYKSVTAPPFLAGSVAIAGSEIATYRLFVIALGLAVAAALFLMIERTVLGMVLRAADSNAAMVRCLGIRVDRLRSFTFALGAALAALGGAVAAPLLPVQIGMGFSIIIDCFMVVIIGGLGNIRGAVAAAVLLGMVQAFGQRYVPDWIAVATYGVLILVLLLRPQGLFNLGRERSA